MNKRDLVECVAAELGGSAAPRREGRRCSIRSSTAWNVTRVLDRRLRDVRTQGAGGSPGRNPRRASPWRSRRAPRSASDPPRLEANRRRGLRPPPFQSFRHPISTDPAGSASVWSARRRSAPLMSKRDQDRCPGPIDRGREAPFVAPIRRLLVGSTRRLSEVWTRRVSLEACSGSSSAAPPCSSC